MRVGIVLPPRCDESAWGGDRRRHGLHLIAALQGLALADGVHVVGPPDQAAVDGGSDPATLTPAQAMEQLDLLIEIDPCMTDEWLSCFRARGGRAVLHPCGSVHTDLIAGPLFNRPGSALQAGRHDAVWLMAGEAIYAPMLRTLHRVPVLVVPALWMATPDYPAYHPGSLAREGARVAIAAPDAGAFDMGSIAFLIADGAARQRPEEVVQAYLVNAAGMVSQWSFACMVRSSDLSARQGVTIDTARDPQVAFRQGCNLLVDHHPRAAAGFACLDALAGGYPVVHNATGLTGVGYAYDGQDIATGAAVLLRAVRDHDATVDQMRGVVAAALTTRHPHAPGNRDAYARALLASCAQMRSAA